MTGQIMLNPIKIPNILTQNNSLLFPKPVVNTKIKAFFCLKWLKCLGIFQSKFLFGHFCSCQNLRGNTASKYHCTSLIQHL